MSCGIKVSNTKKCVKQNAKRLSKFVKVLDSVELSDTVLVKCLDVYMSSVKINGVTIANNCINMNSPNKSN